MTIELADGDELDAYSHYSRVADRWSVHLHKCGDRGCVSIELTPEGARELVQLLSSVIPPDGDEGAGLGPLGRLVLPEAPAMGPGGRRLSSSLPGEMPPLGVPLCGHRYHSGDGTDHQCWLEAGHGRLQHRDSTHTWAGGL